MVAVNPAPASPLQGGDQPVIVGQERVREVEGIPVLPPAGTDLDEAGVLLQELRAVEIAAPVEEDLEGPIGAVDQVSAKLVRGEEAGAGGDLRIGLYGELVRRKTGGDLAQQGKCGEQDKGTRARPLKRASSARRLAE